MSATDLLAELGEKLGFPITLSGDGTCRVIFDEDAVDFELFGESLYVMADVGSAANREDAYGRLLEANCLGRESGGACLGLDASRDVFTLHRVFSADVSYTAFEEDLTLFVKALRYWKEWLALPPAQGGAEEPIPMPAFGSGMLMA